MACWKDADLQLGTTLARIFLSSSRTQLCRSAPVRTLDPSQISGMDPMLLMAYLPWPLVISCHALYLVSGNPQLQWPSGDVPVRINGLLEKLRLNSVVMSVSQRLSVMIFSWKFFKKLASRRDSRL